MQKKFLIAPTFQIGTDYLRFMDRNPREWIILPVDTDRDCWVKIRGVNGGEAEQIVTAHFRESERLQQLKMDMNHRGISIKPVSY